MTAGRVALQRFSATLMNDDNEFDFWFDVFAFADDTTNHKAYWMAVGKRVESMPMFDARKFSQIRQKFCAAMIERIAKRKLTDKLRQHLQSTIDKVRI
jgi:hypothetical protein